jgi:hypothetical protein
MILYGKFTNKTVSKGTLSLKSLLTSLYQREAIYPSLVKRGEGRFYGQCGFTYELLSNRSKSGDTFSDVGTN